MTRRVLLRSVALALTLYSVLSNNTYATIVNCGVDTLQETYCYVNNDSHQWDYESSNGQALIMIFSAGTIESSDYDHIRFYDGIPGDPGVNLIWENTLPYPGTDLSGLQVISPTGNLYMMNTSDGSVSCQSGDQSEWVWQVECLNCQPAMATYNVVTDCDNYQFSVEVNITDLGSDGTLDISADGLGTVLTTATATGVYTVGPFEANIPVNITLSNSDNSLCNVVSPALVNPLCPQIISCGDPAVEFTYCYGISDVHAWHWQAASPNDSLSLFFEAGSIQAAFDPGGDHLTIYDGSDNTSPVLYSNGDVTTDLAGLQVTGTGPDLYMEMSSDDYGSCSSGATTEWDWIVGCADCSHSVATYTVLTDCDNSQFSVDVNIADLGSDASLDIIADGNGVVLATATSTGTVTVGPFTADIPVVLTLQNSENSLCNTYSPSLVNPLCPTIIQCGGVPLDEAYCYTNGDSHAWRWQSSTGGALIMIFSAGLIESNLYDHIRIYDGVPGEPGVNLLWENTLPYPGTNLNDLHVISATGDLYMASTSDVSNSCDDGAYQEWIWQVGCLDCQPATASYNVITDCDNFQYTVEVNITDLGSDGTLDISADSLGTVLATATAAGTYTVGPFTANIPVVITLQNSDNGLCNVHSPLLVNPLCPQILTCGDPAVETLYCYGLNDTHAWHWQADSPSDSLSLLFLAGSIQGVFDPTDGDHLRIYDGPDNTSPLLFDHVSTDNLFDLTDLQVTSSGPDIYMEMGSDNYGSCSSGTTTEWDWLVGCADCSAPVATYAVVTDCDNSQFSVDVDITAMGSNPVIGITNTGGADPVAATAVGTYTVGPFDANEPVTVMLGDDANMLCSIHSPALVNPLCPDTVHCGEDTLHLTYCYPNNDSHLWHWQSSASQPLFMLFSAGTIESADYDHLTIYNGPDDQSPILFDHTMFNQENLAGLQLIASSGHIYMKSSSDGSSSCGSGQTEWAWIVNCLDCTNPAADFSMTEDCVHHSFNVVVNVNDLGSGNSVRITNSLNADTLMNVPLGITNVGPFRMDTTVTVTVLNETNQYCQVPSPEFISTSTACIDSVCEIQLYNYCYANADTAWFMYQGTGPGPITIAFLSGQLLPNDRIQIYNGFNPAIPPLYQGNVGGNLAGFALNTTTAAHQLLLRVVSDASGSCATGETTTPLTWTVSCGAVGIEKHSQSDFSMYPNPTTGQLSIQLPVVAKGNTDLRILDVAGRIVYKETFNATGGLNTFDLKGLQSGNYSVVISTKDWVKAQLLQIVH